MVETRKKYRTLIELAPDPIFLIDSERGTVLEVNETAVDLLDYRRSDLEGMDAARLHPSDQTEAYWSILERTTTEEVLRVDELADGSPIYLVSRDGTRVPVELHARTLYLDGTHLVFTIARDVTRRHQYERELQRRNDQLAAFAGVVAHDLRNPLTVAKGRVELASQECDTEHLAKAAEALDRMEALVEDTLVLAHHGRTVAETEPVPLGELLDDCWEMVATDGTSLERAIPEGTTIHADCDRLRQVLENLFRNAIDHTDDPVVVRIGTMESGIYIEDNGQGISAEDRHEVYSPGVSSNEGGTGFGLAIVEKIVHAHNWDIRVTESSTGGARFEITGVDIDT